jgi:uncharacterized protein (TIGR03089 family)
MTVENLSDLLHQQVRALSDRPLLTYYDAGTGERTELGYATGANWVWKLANLLVEELEVEPGQRVAVLLGGHWTAAVTALACWQVGAAVLPWDPAVADPSLLAGAAVSAVVTSEQAVAAVPVAGLPVLAVGAGMGGRVTADVGDAVPFDEVLAFADDYDDPEVTLAAPALVVPGDAADPAAGWVVQDQAEVLAVARAAGLSGQDRFLVADRLQSVEGLAGGLLAAVVAGASVVLTRGYDEEGLGRIVAAEKVTGRLG